MNRQKAISDRLLLGAIFLGLNLMCFLGIMHGHRVIQHTRVNYSHIPAHSTRRAGGSGSDHDSVASIVAAHLDRSMIDHVSHPTLSHTHANLVGPQAVLAASLFVLARPEGRTEPLAEQNVIALGSAPRAPGLGRAPPIAA